MTGNYFQMLNCILGMVDKTKRALSILQQRQLGHSMTDYNSDHLSPPSRTRFQQPSAPPPQAMSDILTATIRSTEERVIEVRRRAEEAVQEVT